MTQPDSPIPSPNTNPLPADSAPAAGAAPSGEGHPHVPPAGDARANEIFNTTTKFADLGLRNSVLKAIEELGFVHPTLIQATLIPVILAGHDVLGQAKTGTGKTAAFGLPMIHGAERGKEFQGLVLVPTRELAVQVASDIARFAVHTPIKTSAVFGGENVKTQAQRLAKGPEILVATPGRIMDMAQRGLLHYRNVRTVVLDEVDRMLDIGFRDDIRRILRSCPAPGPRDQGGRQTVFVSATISGEIESLARSHALNPQKIVSTSGALTATMVKQFHLTVERWDKRRLLAHLLTHEEPALTVVFCRMKRTVDDLTKYLQTKGIDVHAMHGDMYQSSRNKVMERLRKGNLGVLIASDLASRGLDVEGITHVINYDLPDDPDLYVHRIGRTARAGRGGVAWAFVTPEEGKLLTQIELLINAEIPKLDYPDFKPGPVPESVLKSREQDEQQAKLTQSFNRFAVTANPVVPARPDPTKFPGGVVPTMMPPKRMYGKTKTTRSMKAAISQAAVGANKPATEPPAAQGG
ncbi:MAG: DEAD/DEAH box helicase [Phycisphaeraceae bacterium]|nr:DEAD/DEAH box helicase [Phycisphaeraceae bacterium]